MAPITSRPGKARLSASHLNLPGSYSHVSARLLSSDGSTGAEGCVMWETLVPSRTRAEPPGSGVCCGAGSPGQGRDGLNHGVYCFVGERSGHYQGDRDAVTDNDT